MKLFTQSLLSTLILFYSCTQTKVDTTKAFNFFDSLNYQIGLNHLQQQSFIDQLNKAIISVSEDKTATVDTKKLAALLKISTSINFRKVEDIEDLSETDTDIRFKYKALEYYRIFNSAYKNEIPEVIKILALQTEDRFDRSKDLLFPKLKLIKEKEIEMVDAQKKFRAKYDRIKKLQTSIK